VNAPNVGDLLAGANLTGKAYMEDLPGPCFNGAAAAGYAKKHDPFIYFDNIRNTPTRCEAIVPYSQLAVDLQASALPSYVWITPNMCHDMHDCAVASGDQWLRENVPALLNSTAFTQQRSLLAITWDEDDGGDNRVPLILAGPQVKSGYVSHTRATHYSLLKTFETALGLPSLTANDGAAQPIADVWQS
jgi:phosphatidylinositol-3-phosphatase